MMYFIRIIFGLMFSICSEFVVVHWMSQSILYSYLRIYLCILTIISSPVYTDVPAGMWYTCYKVSGSGLIKRRVFVCSSVLSTEKFVIKFTF